MPSPSCTKDWIDHVTAILPLCIAAYAVWVATWQSKTNREKLRLDLYGRRFHIYEATLTFYQCLMEPNENLSTTEFLSQHRDFIKSCRESRFLFDSSSGIPSLLEELQSQSFKIIGFKKHGADLASDPPTQIKMSDQMHETFILFENSMKRIESAMGKYLDFHNIVVA